MFVYGQIEKFEMLENAQKSETTTTTWTALNLK